MIKGKQKDPGFPAVEYDIKQMQERARFSPSPPAAELGTRRTLNMNVTYEGSMKWQESSEGWRTGQ